MRNRLLTLAALLLAAAPVATGAQAQYHADFPAVRERVQRGQVREAAYTLMLASAHLREEVGRSREGEVAERLLAMETRLDALVAKLRTGEPAPLPTLDAAFAAVDRALADHHVRLAAWESANLRLSSVAELARDLDRAAFHFARAVREEGGTLDAPARRAVDDAGRLVERLAGAAQLPGDAGAVIAALGRVITPAPSLVARTDGR